jgi:dihydroflavonol-4-reductase
MSETVLLTGVSGFIAKHVALKLLNAGYDVRGTLRQLDRANEVHAALAPHLLEQAGQLTLVQADLEADAGWAEAMAGVSAVVHTASPFPITQPKNPQELIRPAVEGTRRVLAAAAAAGVKRIVLTSSVAAVVDLSKGEHLQDEADWCDPSKDTVTAYEKSKTLAERAAWELAKARGLALTTINPGFVLGPPLDEHYGSSLGLVERFLKGKDPMVPPMGLAIVDVRDVAEMHLRALAAAGNGRQALHRQRRCHGLCRHGPHAQVHLAHPAHPHARSTTGGDEAAGDLSTPRSAPSCRASATWTGSPTPAPCAKWEWSSSAPRRR